MGVSTVLHMGVIYIPLRRSTPVSCIADKSATGNLVMSADPYPSW